MLQSTRVKAKLPRKLLEELGVADDHGRSRGQRNGPGRKEQRKAARVQRKAGGLPSRTQLPNSGIAQRKRSQGSDTRIIEEPRSTVPHRHAKAKTEQDNIPKSILKKPKANPISEPVPRRRDSTSPSSPLPTRVSQGTKDRLSADDAEIAALEKALGLKGKTNLPKAFADDGLDTLLDDLGGSRGKDEALAVKRKRTEEDEWLQRKRRKARGEISPGRTFFDGKSSARDDGESEGDRSTDNGLALSGDDDGADSIDLSSEKTSTPEPQNRKARENPYRAPVTVSSDGRPSKYIPPSLRNEDPHLAEDLSPLRRQLQGLLNRLSEANLISVLRDIEKLYQNNARQHVSTTLIDLLMGLLCDPTSLQDTFIILHAGFVAAVYKIIGTEFGAQTIQRIHEKFFEYYPLEAKVNVSNKRTVNLISLLAELYNFQVIGSNLIYDFIRIFLDDLSETSTELILKIMRNSGPQLRQDDASSLKDIVLLLQSAVAKKGEERLSVRAKFMIETINNLKNNRMKTGITASTIASEHTIRMKKTLGSLNLRNIRAGEPLRVGLRDLQESDKRGKWWLIGASYKDESRDRMEKFITKDGNDEFGNELDVTDSTSTDLVQLAQEQRMNTDVRRSIFIAIMSATDYKDAHLRLQKLRLKKAQELEIPKVLVHCAAAEKTYNPFYSLVARRVCSDRKLKMAFQFSLWDLFKRMGEGQDDAEAEPDGDSEEKLGLRCLVNLAKLYGVLIAEGGVGITVLKTLNLAYLQPKTRTFVEVLLISVILHSQQGSSNKRDEKPIMEVFLSKDNPNLARGLRYFMRKVVSKTDVAGGKQDRETVVWGCKVAADALRVVVSSVVAE